jgi:type II secretory pathway pseudopilin PulG
MRATKAFTLAELLAVIGIMLVLTLAAFGVFAAFSQQSGPDNAVSTIQAMLNGARDFASSNDVITQIEFSIDPANISDGTVMKLKYWDVKNSQWVSVPSAAPISLHSQIIVCRNMPDTLPTLPTSVAVNAQDPTDTELAAWKKYEKDLLDAVTTHAMSGNQVRVTHQKFSVQFDSTGFVCADPSAAAASPIYALTVVQIGGVRATGYAFYPLNAISGTRIVFE